jgi:hypothetical protein
MAGSSGMIHWKTLTDDQARYAIDSGEFPTDVTSSHENVALILTQGWCPQWTTLKRDLENITAGVVAEIVIYTYIYDGSPLFMEFLDLKERVLGNVHIPYIRYYKKGALQAESNFVSSQWFLKQFA